MNNKNTCNDGVTMATPNEVDQKHLADLLDSVRDEARAAWYSALGVRNADMKVHLEESARNLAAQANALYRLLASLGISVMSDRPLVLE